MLNVAICFNMKAYTYAKREGLDTFFLVFPKDPSLQEDNSHVYIPIEPLDDKSLAKKYTSVIINNSDNIAKASLNNSYYYGIATAANISEYIYKQLCRLPVKNVVIYADNVIQYVPFLSTGWGESSTNLFTSTDVFSPYVKQRISPHFSVSVRKYNLLSNLKSRLSFSIRAITIPLLIASSSLRKLRYTSFKSKPRKGKYYFLVRTKHQLNIALNIIQSLSLTIDDVTFIEIENISSTGLLKAIVEKNFSIISPYNGLSGIASTLKSLYLTYKNILFSKLAPNKAYIRHNNMTFKLESFIQDAYFLSNIHLYVASLQKLLTINSEEEKIIFSFEQVSPQAYLENEILDNSSTLIFIKSTLIQEISMPCICWGDTFLVNDIKELNLKKFSILNSESIKFYGSPKYSSIYGLKSELSKSIKKVIFATQPHEISINKAILEKLLTIAKKENFLVIVRKHPRDNGKYPNAIKGSLSFDNSNNLYQQLADADLVVSRTSTILEECIYIGVPYISCLFSAKDKAYSARYLDHKSQLIVMNKDELITKITNYTLIMSNFITWRNSYLKYFKVFSLDEINN